MIYSDTSKATRYKRLDMNSLPKEDDFTRYQCHGLFPYPAMMVPRLQGELIDELLRIVPDATSVYDPFVGSGTVLSESLSRGLNFFGSDINPLALLCCEVKSDPFDQKQALRAFKELNSGLAEAQQPGFVKEFPGADKWFPKDVRNSLEQIRIHISMLEERWCRRIFWLGLAELVRKVSRTRKSTYKLHIDRGYRPFSHTEIIDLFLRICSRNIELKNDSWDFLKERDFLRGCAPSSAVSLELTDVRCTRPSFKSDLVVTSPPYGDNQTTVTYGQFSYLPLQFIDLNDIEQRFDHAKLNGPSVIDSASLGGSLKEWSVKLEEVAQYSNSLRQAVSNLRHIGRGGEKRLGVFGYDLRQSLISIAQRVKIGGFCMMTLGNRRINGFQVPLDEIVKDFLEPLGFSKVVTLGRSIRNKRMAGTMNSEKILIMEKVG